MASRNSFSCSKMNKTEKARVDEVLVLQGLCESRSQAKAFILAGQVRLGTEKLDKAAKIIPTNAPISLERPMPYVGRGGLKMENFLRESQIAVPSCPILDLGASTGGFTDCLLQKGASQATCIDVGHGQLHYKLRTDSRVTNFEKTNLRHLDATEFEGAPFSLVVMDLSFISLRKVLSSAWGFVKNDGILISLVKPQFECKKEEADQTRGIIRDDKIRKRVLNEIIAFAEEKLPEGKLLHKLEASPAGTDGNKEYFLAWQKLPS